MILFGQIPPVRVRGSLPRIVELEEWRFLELGIAVDMHASQFVILTYLPVFRMIF